MVKRGYASVKEDGIRSWIWSKRWLLLREQTLTFHRNEVCWVFGGGGDFLVCQVCWVWVLLSRGVWIGGSVGAWESWLLSWVWTSGFAQCTCSVFLEG